MAKGSDTKQRASANKRPDKKQAGKKVGPPMLMLVLGYLLVFVSVPLIFIEGIGAHVIGYVVGSLVPILIVGFVRRIDLDRRRSPFYEPNRLLAPGLALLAGLAIAIAALSVWPIATELAS